jgi:hypothetical protein
MRNALACALELAALLSYTVIMGCVEATSLFVPLIVGECKRCTCLLGQWHSGACARVKRWGECRKMKSKSAFADCGICDGDGSAKRCLLAAAGGGVRLGGRRRRRRTGGQGRAARRRRLRGGRVRGAQDGARVHDPGRLGLRPGQNRARHQTLAQHRHQRRPKQTSLAGINYKFALFLINAIELDWGLLQFEECVENLFRAHPW